VTSIRDVRLSTQSTVTTLRPASSRHARRGKLRLLTADVAIDSAAFGVMTMTMTAVGRGVSERGARRRCRPFMRLYGRLWQRRAVNSIDKQSGAGRRAPRRRPCPTPSPSRGNVRPSHVIPNSNGACRVAAAQRNRIQYRVFSFAIVIGCGYYWRPAS